MTLTSLRQYASSKIRDDLEETEFRQSDQRLLGFHSERYDDIQLYWDTALDEGEFETVLEGAGGEPDMSGYRLGDAFVNYESGVIGYSSADGNLRDLESIRDLVPGETDLLVERLEAEFQLKD